MPDPTIRTEKYTFTTISANEEIYFDGFVLAHED
jgi:hypothetical protein